MTYLPYAIAFIVVIMVIIRIVGYRQLRGMSLRAGGASVVTPDEVPADIRGVLDGAGAALAEAGFISRGYARWQSSDADDDRPVWSLLAEHPEQATWAILWPSPLPEPEAPLWTSFVTPLAGGGLLMSMDGISGQMPGGLPGVTLCDHGTIDPLAAWRSHRGEVKLRRIGTPIADAAALISGQNGILAERLPWLDRQRLVERDRRDGRVRLTRRAAWSSLGGIQRANVARQRAIAAQRKADLARQKGRTVAQRSVPEAIEADAVLRHRQSEQTRRLGGSPILLFIISLAVFIAVSKFNYDGVQTIAVLVGVLLLLHEFGHFLAMRCFGYRDTEIFFLPFLGAAATGRKEDATVVQQVVVSLMGPMPGIVLGLALLLGGQPVLGQATHQVAMMLIIINLFNLLPVLPFDGGQIVSRTLFARQPWLDFAFSVLAVAALIGMGWWFAPILLWLGLFFALGLIGQRRTAGLRSRVLRDPLLVRLRGEEQIRALAAVVSQDPCCRHLPFAERLRLVQALGTTLERVPASLVLRLALFVLYVIACLLAPVVWAIWLAVP